MGLENNLTLKEAEELARRVKKWMEEEWPKTVGYAKIELYFSCKHVDDKGKQYPGTREGIRMLRDRYWVPVTCSNCGRNYSDHPTQKEMREFRRMMNAPFTI